MQTKRTALAAILFVVVALSACGSSADCERLCTEALQACTDKGTGTCVDRCISRGGNVSSLHCAGYSTCSAGLCCLGFYYGSSEQQSLCN